jgi:hypothetical protein
MEPPDAVMLVAPAIAGQASRVGGRYVPGSLEGETAGVGADVASGAGLRPTP